MSRGHRLDRDDPNYLSPERRVMSGVHNQTYYEARSLAGGPGGLQGGGDGSEDDTVSVDAEEEEVTEKEVTTATTEDPIDKDAEEEEGIFVHGFNFFGSYSS